MASGATVIDSLSVEIGIDPQKLTEGLRDLQRGLGEASRSLETFGSAVEHQTAKLGGVFKTLKGGIIGIVGALVGGEIAKTIDAMMKLDAATYRYARTMGESVHTLSFWQQQMRLVGGSAEDATASFVGLNDAFMDFAMNVSKPSPAFMTVMNRAGINPWSMPTPSEALMKIMPSLVGQTPQQQYWSLRQVPGLSQDFKMYLMDLLGSPERMADLKNQLAAFGTATDKSAKAAVDLQQKEALIAAGLEKADRALVIFTDSVLDAAAAVGTTQDNPAAHEYREGHGPDISDLWSRGKAWFKRQLGSSDKETPGVREFVRKAAIEEGIDPDQALRVFTGESGLNINAVGDNDTSFGVTQLHIGGGLGDKYFVETGHDPRESKYWQEQVKFSLRKAHEEGWGPWHAWHGDPWAGIDRSKPIGPQSRLEDWHAYSPMAGRESGGGNTSNVTVGAINITSNKADPKAVADEIPDSLKRWAMLGSINSGMDSGFG